MNNLKQNQDIKYRKMEGIVMKTIKKILCFVVTVAIVVAGFQVTAEAATKVKLNKKAVTLTITDSKKNPTTTLKVKGVSSKVAKKAKWSTSKKSVATVKKGKVTAKKAGKATITCKVKGKKYTCKVTVKDNRTKNTGTLNVTITQKASETGLGPKHPAHAPKGFEDLVSDSYLRSKGGGEPYGVNKITVTYNGKDVTNEAKYEIDNTQVACVTSPGVIKATNQGMLFNLTVSYKGVEKTFRMGKTTVANSHIICYCGEVFARDEFCTLQNPCSDDEPCPHCKHSKENRCGGHWIGQYVQYIDIRIKE